jgi:TPR repeat protein
MLLALVSLLAPMAPGFPSPPTDLNQTVSGQNAWRQMGEHKACGLPAMTCARNALAEGRGRDAAAYLATAARKGDPLAMRGLGQMLLRGEVFERDPQAALGWLYEAAIRGDKPAMRLLGDAFRTGTGVAADPKLADFWSAKASR